MRTMQLTLDDDGFVRNRGDDIGDDIASMPPAMRELREATVRIILDKFRSRGPHTCTKVAARGWITPGPDGVYRVGGYVTMLTHLLGKTPRQMEGMLGFGSGALQEGADIFFIDEMLTTDRIGPRYLSSWAAGVSPRDLERLGAKLNPSYPSSASPVFQCVIYRHRRARASLKATLAYDKPLPFTVA